MQNLTRSKSSRFAIEVIDESRGSLDLAQPSYALGRIIIGEFVEEFQMDLTFWQASDYVENWSRALSKLDDSSTAVTGLISSITDPATSNFLSWWPLYRIDDEVFVRNELLFLEELSRPFDASKPWSFVSPRDSLIDEDGNVISEWATNMAEIRDFRRGGTISANEE